MGKKSSRNVQFSKRTNEIIFVFAVLSASDLYTKYGLDKYGRTSDDLVFVVFFFKLYYVLLWTVTRTFVNSSRR